MKLFNRTQIYLLLAFSLVASSAQAHVGLETQGWFTGMLHPLSGLDHWSVMLAVGLWARQQKQRIWWVIPLAFVGVMAIGGAIAMAGFTLPFIEQGIVSSMLLLGLLLALAIQLPLGITLPLIALLAWFHGQAHGSEIPENVLGFSYSAGFLISTLVLHGCGLGLALGIRAIRQPNLVKLLGLLLALAGGYQWLAV